MTPQEARDAHSPFRTQLSGGTVATQSESADGPSSPGHEPERRLCARVVDDFMVEVGALNDQLCVGGTGGPTLCASSARELTDNATALAVPAHRGWTRAQRSLKAMLS